MNRCPSWPHWRRTCRGIRLQDRQEVIWQRIAVLELQLPIKVCNEREAARPVGQLDSTVCSQQADVGVHPLRLRVAVILHSEVQVDRRHGARDATDARERECVSDTSSKSLLEPASLSKFPSRVNKYGKTSCLMFFVMFMIFLVVLKWLRSVKFVGWNNVKYI